MKPDQSTLEISSIEHLVPMVEKIEFGMLTHTDNEANLVSRPMTVQKFDVDSKTLWFFASDESLKSKILEDSKKVNITFSEPRDNRYISFSGLATLNHDRAQMERLWKPSLKLWFPEGLETPHICLIEIQIERAEFWDASAGKMVQIWNILKSLATGQKVEALGEHKNIRLH